MKYCTKPVIVDAFRFGADAEVTCPEWFQKELEKEKICIDRSIVDGAVKVYGCTIYNQAGRMKAKCGDYIVMEPSGQIMPYKEKEFQKTYERMRDNG